MNKKLGVGASSGIGFELAHQLPQTHEVWTAGRCKPDLEHIRHVTWDATAETFPSDELPETLSGLVYCLGRIHLQPSHRLKYEH